MLAGWITISSHSSYIYIYNFILILLGLTVERIDQFFVKVMACCGGIRLYAQFFINFQGFFLLSFDQDTRFPQNYLSPMTNSIIIILVKTDDMSGFSFGN